MLTQEALINKFYYDNGHLHYNYNSGHMKMGDVAGYPNRYWLIRTHGKMYLAHRLVWLYHHGRLPEQLDHINGDKLDNRIENLRPATKQQNEWNKGDFSSNTSGIKGVSWSKQKNKWRAYIWKDRKQINLGLFDDIETAKIVVDEARVVYHGQYANSGGKPNRKEYDNAR